MRPIDADKLSQKVRRAILGIADTPLPNEYASKLAVKMGEAFQKLIDEAPTAVRRGRWQFEARGKDGRTEQPVCSWCGATPKYYVPKNSVGMQVPPYCHECGTNMDAEVKDENT